MNSLKVDLMLQLANFAKQKRTESQMDRSEKKITVKESTRLIKKILIGYTFVNIFQSSFIFCADFSVGIVL